MTKPLSPAAQAILDAHDDAPWGDNFATADRLAIAAALRAVAASKPWAGHAYGKTLWHVGWDAAMDHVETIAAELEGTDG